MKGILLPELQRMKRCVHLWPSGWLFCLLALLPVLPALSQGQGQHKKVSISFNNVSLDQCIEQLQQQAGISFYYNPDDIKPLTKKYTKSFSGNTVTEIVHYLLAGTGLEFEAADEKKLVIRKTKEVKPRLLRKITGTVTDAKTGTPLAGADISIQGQRLNTITDANGIFALNVRDSVAVLAVSIIGYATSFITVHGEEAVSIKLTTDTKSLGGVVVEARRKINNEIALLNDRKNAAIVSDGISAQNIERTASITTTQALQRVSGITITDDKYVAIRGLGDRSVIAEMNGVRLSSSDPDRSAIPLDLIPANLLDNITVYKTNTPDKPADAAAGIVELKTKSIPTSKTLSITAQTGWNSNIGWSGKLNSFYNSDMGFLGQKIKNHELSSDFLNLSKQYPAGLPQIQDLISAASNNPAKLQEADRISNIMHGFDPVLTTRYKNAQLNGIYAVTYGNTFHLFKHHHQLGVIAGGSYYHRSTDIAGGELNQYSIYEGILTGSSAIRNPRIIPAYVTPNNINLGKYLGYKENTGTESLSYGLLGGLTYKFNKNHEVNVQYLGSRGGETQASNLYGRYNYTYGLTGPVFNTIYSLKQSYRTLNTFNFQGEHKLGNGQYAPRLSYNGASSRSTQTDPDYRFINLVDYRPAGGASYTIPSGVPNAGFQEVATTDLYALVSGYVNGYGPYGKIQVDPNGRRFRRLNETNYNYKADLSFPFPLFGQSQLFKTGFNYLHRNRDFSEYILSLPGSNFSTYGAIPLYQVYGNVDQLAGYNQVGIHIPTATTGEGAPLLGGFLYNSQKSPNNYKGYYETNAFYGMLDLHPIKALRLTGGVRFEKTNIQSVVDTSGVYISPSLKDGSVNLVYTNPNSAYVTQYKPYYSINITYTLKEKMNFRTAYSTTLARPELRELTNVFDFDPFQGALVVGNSSLRNQETTNYDFRWEWFPHPGEVFSASLFAKEITNQLEKVFIQNSDGVDAKFPEFPAVEYRNDPNKGHVWGIELEIAKDLGKWWTPLNHFFLGSNLLLAQSNILKNTQRLNAARIIDRQSPAKSPLFEQAPYSVNTYINYTNTRTGTDVTATFNVVGERLIQVNLDGSPDLYSRPVPVFDFVFSQRLLKKLVLKGYVKNAFNHPYKEVYANPGNGGKFYGKEYIRRSYQKGAEYMLGLTYNLF